MCACAHKDTLDRYTCAYSAFVQTHRHTEAHLQTHIDIYAHMYVDTFIACLAEYTSFSFLWLCWLRHLWSVCWMKYATSTMQYDVMCYKAHVL